MKKIYLSVDWISRSISVSTKKEWEEYKEYLVEESKCGEYKDRVVEVLVLVLKRIGRSIRSI